MLVVHPHFHARYTGATRHVETMLALLPPEVEARGLGATLDPSLPQITLGEVSRRARTEQVVWHAHRVNELLTGLSLRALRPSLKVVFTRHSVGRPAALTRWAAARADARISVSPETARDFGLPSEVVLHGVDLRRFHPPQDRAAAWAHKALGGRFGLGVVGRLRPDKGVGELIDAVVPLLRDRDDWRVVLIGLVKDEHRSWLAGKLAQSGGALVHVGEQRRIEEWYQALTVVVSPSHEESFGLVRAEALASGCALIATRLNALDAKLQDGVNALLYDVGDHLALRGHLAALLADPTRATALGEAGARLAQNELSAQRQAERLRALYAGLV